METVKQLAMSGCGDDCIQSSVYDVLRDKQWPTPYRLRTLQNAVTGKWHDDLHGLHANIEQQRAEFAEAVQHGDGSRLPVIVGEAVDLINDCPSASELIQRTLGQAGKLLSH